MSKLALDLLLSLRPAGQFGLTPENLLSDARSGRHRDLAEPVLERALRDLADKSFVTTVDSPISGKRWRITALGESALKEDGL